jgi:ATP-dependent helicase HrpB
VGEALLGLLTREQRQALDREAPERLVVPSGCRHRVQYERGKPPVLAVRIQELFGLAETPRLGRGRVPVLLHLLAPSYRPEQVTSDLASFWREAYHVVRKDLRLRYPKHSWPEDPLRAKPEAKGRR